MLTLADIDFFRVIARSPSLAAAARVLDVTPSAVTQRLQELERRVGLPLVLRSGRRIALTDEGELLLARGRSISDEVASLIDGFAERRGEVVGHLRILAPLGFGRRFVAPLVGDFAQAHPKLTLALVLSDRPARIPESDWDVAVHVGERPVSTGSIRTLAPNRRVLCASPEYVARHGVPARPQDLNTHRCIALRENDEDVTLWRFTDANRRISQVRIAPVLASNDGDVAREWALDGRGIIVRSEWSIAEDVRTGRLMPLLDSYRLPDADVVAVVGSRGGQLARTVQFLKALRASLTPAPWRDSGRRRP